MTGKQSAVIDEFQQSDMCLVEEEELIMLMLFMRSSSVSINVLY